MQAGSLRPQAYKRRRYTPPDVFAYAHRVRCPG